MGYRLARESSEILKELTLIIQNKLRNPNIDQMLTLTGVELSKDVKYADIFVSSFYLVCGRISTKWTHGM